jgi:NAD+ synthase
MEKIANTITEWLKDYASDNQQKGFVVGISGGIDSAVVSTLCARTGLPTLCITMPIHQVPEQEERAIEHIKWLENNFKNIDSQRVDLTATFDSLMADIFATDKDQGLAGANTRSRLRMTTLYAYANSLGYIVAGTGNKVEDYGVAFFTKFGDGGVDISPIGDLTKTQVWDLGRYLGINKEIIDAKPTDGLWAGDRTDEDQIGATYPELETAMSICEEFAMETLDDLERHLTYGKELTYSTRELEVLKIYMKRHEAGAHKMNMPPICKI